MMSKLKTVIMSDGVTIKREINNNGRVYYDGKWVKPAKVIGGFTLSLRNLKINMQDKIRLLITYLFYLTPIANFILFFAWLAICLAPLWVISLMIYIIYVY
jgi:hypothetical protein|tara:strand:- start:773 stop:1075 length:303 start_codon:yes stop_codon:yes gene_type:complete